MIIIFILLLVVILRHEVLYPVNDNIGTVIGFSVMKFFGVTFYLYLSSIYMTCLKFIIGNNMRKIIYFIVGITCLPIISMNKISHFTEDRVLSGITITLLISFFISGDRYFKRLLEIKPLNEGEIDKAFLSYPPKNNIDFLFFYIIVAIILVLPTIGNFMWKTVILK